MVTVRLNPTLDGRLQEELVQLWTTVVNSGGTVGFAAPVTTEEVRPVAQLAFARAQAGLQDLAVAFMHDMVIGMGFLDPGEPPLQAHIGTVRRLMRHPAHARAGIGAIVLAALERAARRRGIGRVVVAVRGGSDKEGWYASRGYTIDGLLPDRVRVGGQPIQVVVMSKSLDGVGDDNFGGGSGMTRLEVQRLDSDLPLPSYARTGDAGLDLYSAVDRTLAPGERAVLPTGLAVAVPTGFVGLVHPRSGLAARSGLGLVNSPGTIDAGYRGEIKIIAINWDPREGIEIARGDRIAQLLVQRVARAEIVEVQELPASERGDSGFGSSGR